MPVNKKMMKNMKKEYGKEKGERVYYAMENKRKHKGAAKASLISNLAKRMKKG